MDQEAPVADLPQFLLHLLDDRRAARHRGIERCGRWEHRADRIASLAWRRQFYRDTNSERRASALLSHRLRAAARQGLQGVDLYDHILGHLRGTYRAQVFLEVNMAQARSQRLYLVPMVAILESFGNMPAHRRWPRFLHRGMDIQKTLFESRCIRGRQCSDWLDQIRRQARGKVTERDRLATVVHGMPLPEQWELANHMLVQRTHNVDQQMLANMQDDDLFEDVQAE